MKRPGEEGAALLAVLELKGTDTQAFDDAVEELCKVVNHHLTEEELTILNHADKPVALTVRIDAGCDFADLFEVKDALRKKGRYSAKVERRKLTGISDQGKAADRGIRDDRRAGVEFEPFGDI